MSGSAPTRGRLVHVVDAEDTRWRVVATIEGRFGAGGVVLPRTTALDVAPA